MHGVEAMGSTQEVVRRFAAAANAREFGHAVRLNVQFITGLHDGGADGVVPATGT